MRHFLRPSSRVCLSSLLLCVVVSCATLSNVEMDEYADVSRHATWDWLLSSGGRVEAHTRGDVGLERKITADVVSAMKGLGFRHDPRHPSLLVYLHVDIRKQLVKETRTGAMRVLSSLHESPSYCVQVSDVEHHYYDIAELRIV